MGTSPQCVEYHSYSRQWTRPQEPERDSIEIFIKDLFFQNFSTSSLDIFLARATMESTPETFIPMDFVRSSSKRTVAAQWNTMWTLVMLVIRIVMTTEMQKAMNAMNTFWLYFPEPCANFPRQKVHSC